MPSAFSVVRVIPACTAESRSYTPPIPTVTPADHSTEPTWSDISTGQLLAQHPTPVTPLSQHGQIYPQVSYCPSLPHHWANMGRYFHISPFPFSLGIYPWYLICDIPDLLSQHRLSQQTRRRTACPAPATHRQEIIRMRRFSYIWENERYFSPAPTTDRQQIIRVHLFCYFWENERGFSPAPAKDWQEISRVLRFWYFFENKREWSEKKESKPHL